MAKRLLKKADGLHWIQPTAAELGYRMPAEWEPQVRLWLTPPHNRFTWPGCLAKAQKQYRAFQEAVSRQVDVVTTPASGIRTNDSWIRDYGPIFVVRSSKHSPIDGLPGKAIHDFVFNGWGNKYGRCKLDDHVPKHVARRLNLPIWSHRMVLEGGSIDVNGVGTVMTTEQCLMNPNRNPSWTKKQIEQALHDAMGTRHVIWLPGGIIGDDTDGHVDDIARFVATDRVLALKAPTGHPDQPMLDLNWRSLQNARDQDGRHLTVMPLTVPEPVLYDFPRDRFGPSGVAPVPASYANFLICNGAVFVPTFGQQADEIALKQIEQALPKYRVVPLRAEWLVIGLGAFHCLSQQEPA